MMFPIKVSTIHFCLYLYCSQLDPMIAHASHKPEQISSTSANQGEQTGRGASTRGAPNESVQEVTGIVLDSRNQSPVPRALVRLGNRAVLTNHDGFFRFPSVTSASISLTLTKPGFYQQRDGEQLPRLFRLPNSAPIKLLLYPEAILSGHVLDSAGIGIGGLSVTAVRSVFDEAGLHWIPAGQSQTSDDGEYRIALPSGRYGLHLTSHGRLTQSREVVMPLAVPESADSSESAIHLEPGDDYRLDLRPESRRSFTVSVTTDAGGRGFPSLTLLTAAGTLIPLAPIPDRNGAGFHIAVPVGTYTLLGTMQSRDGMAEASTSLTVVDRDLSGVALRFNHVAALPIVVEPETSISSQDSANMPKPDQLGLFLQHESTGMESMGQMMGVSMRANRPIFSAAEGRYRLHAQSGGRWHVTSATCGGLDLLTQDLPISSALDGTAIRIRISTESAILTGSVKLRSEPALAWVYLVAVTPSATPVLVLRVDGELLGMSLAPGSYRALATQSKLNADLRAAASLEPYLDRVQTFTVASGEQRTIVLDVVPEQDVSQ